MLQHISLEMLERISFGQKELVDSMLTEAQREIKEWVSDYKSKGHLHLDFDELHKLKTTFTMIQASSCIHSCQQLLDHIGQKEDDVHELDPIVDTLVEETYVVIGEIETLLESRT